MIAVISIVLVLYAVIIGVSSARYWINDIDRQTEWRTTLQVDPEVKKEESELKKKASKKYQQDFDNADEAIAKNIKSGTVWYHKDVSTSC